MTVGKISATCWIIFGVMCLAFGPVAAGIIAVHAIPHAVGIVLAVLVAGGLWWGPFAYAMYVSMAVVKNGDRRLLKRGTSGTAVVLSAKATRETIQSGEFAWEAPRVYKYRLRVNVPGKNPYETDCRICAAGIRPGSTVNVAVSPLNRKRVTIDIGQGRSGAAVPPSPMSGGVGPRSFAVGPADLISDGGLAGHDGPSSNAQRISELSELGRLHSQGVLTDAEFAAEKARILSQ